MIIIGVLLAVAVLLDGFRRMRKERGDTIRLAAKRRRDADDDLVNPELPGAARVVAVREEPSLHLKRAASPVDTPESDSQAVASESTEHVAVDWEDDTERQAEETARPDADPIDDDILFQDPELEYGGRARPQPDKADTRSWNRVEDDVHSSDDDERSAPGAAITASADDRVGDVEPAPIPRSKTSSQHRDEGMSANRGQSASDEGPQELIVLNVMAPDDKPYSGPDVLQVLLACDVRFGRMNIFHRHEKSDGTGAEQFSVANIVEPGYFDLDGMDDFTTPGLLFFMNLPGPEDSVKAFDAMVETARCLVKNLGGELRDQTHSVATKQTLEHYKQRIRDFERRQLTLM